jgi:ubiquitin C-terminal hydrolase
MQNQLIQNQNQLIQNQIQQIQILNKNNQNTFRNQNLLPNQKNQNFLPSQNNLNNFQNKNNPIIIKDQINPNFNQNQSNQAFSQNQINPNFNQNQFNQGFNQNNNAFSQNQFNPNFNQIQFNPNLMQNKLLNNNQIQNNGISIDYEKEIEKNANEIFKFDFLKNFELDYYPTKGLNNVGLTCYMNSTLQCLLHIPELTFFFVNSYIEFSNKYEKIIQKTETKGKISKEYKALLSEIYTNSRNFFGFDSSVSPKKFNDLISRLNPQFSKYQSNDAKDLIIYLLQEMHEELNYFGGQKLQKIPQCNQLDESDSFKFFYEVNSKMNFSIISYLFWGIVKQTTICKVCKSTLFNFQYFQYLSFPLYRYANTKFNIYRGLKDYIAEEILTGDNQFYCQKCQNLRDAKIFSKIYYTSPYLLINLDYGKNKIYIPKEIDYGSIIILSKEFLEIKAGEITYNLIAVSSHIGSSGNSGHYITYCRDIKSDSWYKFNDSSVSKCDFENTKEYSPYLLLFKKVKQTFK